MLEKPELPPSRPPNPIRPGRLLLISEAPPLSGGFWGTRAQDDLRGNVLTLLGYQDLAEFLANNLFLVQALKWPLARVNRKKRPGFNQLGPSQQIRLIDHAVSAHLSKEIDLIAPSVILAMGNAAWRACLKMFKDNLPCDQSGVERLRGSKFLVPLQNGSALLAITFLPVGQNMRDPARAEAIRQDFKEFISGSNTQ